MLINCSKGVFIEICGNICMALLLSMFQDLYTIMCSVDVSKDEAVQEKV